MSNIYWYRRVTGGGMSITVYEPGLEEERRRWRNSWVGALPYVLGPFSGVLVGGGLVALDARLAAGLFVLALALACCALVIGRLRPSEPGQITVTSSDGDGEVQLLLRGARAAEAAVRNAARLDGGRDDLALSAGLLPMALWRLAEAVQQSAPGTVADEVLRRVTTMEHLAARVQAAAIDRTPLDAFDALIMEEKDDNDGR